MRDEERAGLAPDMGKSVGSLNLPRQGRRSGGIGRRRCYRKTWGRGMDAQLDFDADKADTRLH